MRNCEAIGEVLKRTSPAGRCAMPQASKPSSINHELFIINGQFLTIRVNNKILGVRVVRGFASQKEKTSAGLYPSALSGST